MLKSFKSLLINKVQCVSSENILSEFFFQPTVRAFLKQTAFIQFGNPMLINMDFGDLISSFFSVFNDQFEKLYQTVEKVFY